MGIEEREQYDGWLYMFPGSPRCTMFVLLEEPESSKAAKLVSTYVLLLILYSSTTFVVETLQAVQNSPSTLRFLGHSETFCILHFTVEYVGRAFTCTARPYSQNGFLPYVTAPENLVDIVSILPFYIEIFFGGEVGLSVLRVLRMARIFRVFKVSLWLHFRDVWLTSVFRCRNGRWAAMQKICQS
jgi:voltage-gated potassium channel